MPEKHITSQEKHDVVERAKGSCEYCRSQVRFAMQPFSVEHIVPALAVVKQSLKIWL